MSIWVGITYLILLLVIGLITARRNQRAGDYFLAGRQLGPLTMVLTTMASVMSGFVFVGGPGLFYQVGLASFWIVISSSFTGALMCWLLAKPLFDLSHRGRCLTIPDVILSRYQCRFSSGLASVAILVGVLGYLATQLKALAVILSSTISLEGTWAVGLAVAVLVFYTVAGGMKAGVYTDVLQGAIMLWAATMVGYYSLNTTGGISNLLSTLAHYDPVAISPWGSVGASTALGWFFLFSVGSLGQPHVINRFMMVRDLKSLRLFPLALAISMMICGIFWLGSGSAVRTLVAQGDLAALRDADETITVFLTQVAPAWFAPFAYIAIVAAIMSTADSFVSIGAAALTRDLPRAFGFRTENEVRWGRLWTLLLFIGAGTLAFSTDTLVAYLGVFSFGSFAAALTAVLVLGLNWPGADRWAARGSMVAGLLSSFILAVLDRSGSIQIPTPPGVIGLIVSLLVFLVLGKLVSGPMKPSPHAS